MWFVFRFAFWLTVIVVVLAACQPVSKPSGGPQGDNDREGE